ncbi:hypothetical protein AC578_2064 [Pseudocercospora eumusae]|uniref:Adenylosuccinate lyase C-terminal domain-containing protein n=1 Tax=Pseudocercospora eumusae TaxID=321146 RepID=A0A139H8N0_9PEZI|nr:hypothetical protein AC578_2064 [Pseudocercospora eumusae]
MATIIDSQIFGNVFSTPEVSNIWSDRQRTAYYLEFEAALAKAQAQLGIIPQKACDQIVKHCTLDNLDFEELRKQTELIGYPVLPMVQQLVKKINAVEDRLGEWIHWGTTTQDLTDTATVLQLRDTIKLIEEVLDGIIAALVKLCQKHRSTPMAARSNLQQAVPMSFGFKMARLLSQFQRHKQRLHEVRPRLLVCEFSGAAGTLATITPETSHDPPDPNTLAQPLALECQRLLASEIGLSVPTIAWHTERDTFAELSTFFSLLTSTCAKFATDLKLMMQLEVGEAREPYVPHRGSSSTMPQKRNPIGSAYVCAMASSVRQMSTGMVEAMVADFERSTGPWEIEWILLPQICCLTMACLEQTRYLLEGLEVDEDGMRRNLELSKGAIVSEAVMMGLGKKIGRQYAHDLVYGLCRKAQVEGRSLLELLKEDEEIKKVGLEEGELERLCDPGNYLGLSEEMVDIALKSVGQG